MALLLRRVSLVNYKSIARCQVDPNDLCLLVGPNGSGKSNFLDAIRLVSESLDSTLEYAIRQRGGINEVRRRSSGHPTHFTVSLRIGLDDGGNGLYAFKIGATRDGSFRVQQENAAISGDNYEAHYEIRDGEIKKFEFYEDGKRYGASALAPTLTNITSDRLFLATLSGVAAFRPLFDALSKMGFYNINPALVRELQPYQSGDLLQHDGGNIASVIKRLESDNPRALDRIQQYLREIVPGIEGVHYRPLGPRETIEFRQRVPGAQKPWRFYAANMSDGTLRSLGVLTALFHRNGNNSPMTPLVAIEEPESTIHPGAAAVIMDALFEASHTAQILVTTHSPDLLDHEAIDSTSILAFKNVDGVTTIAPVDKASVSGIKEHLLTAGELLRNDQLQPDDELGRPMIRQSDMFEM